MKLKTRKKLLEYAGYAVIIGFVLFGVFILQKIACLTVANCG